MNRSEVLQPRTPLKQKIALLLFGVFLFLALLEASLRLGGSILLSIQDHGNLQSIQQKGAYRILCLGESTTQNQYPRFLEEALNQRNLGVRFGVIDKGRAATSTSAILSQVEPYLNEYHPDMVVAMMGINDKGEHIPYETATSNKGILFIRSFKTYKLARFLWLNILAKAKETGLHQPGPDSRLFGNLAGSLLTEAAFKKAIELNPKNDNAYVELGRLYRDQDQYLQAEGAFKQAIRFNPKNDKAYAGLGRLYRHQAKFPQAEHALKKAIELNPKNDKAYFELGWLYRDYGKIPQAENAFKKTVDLKPKNKSTYVALGWIYLDQGKIPQAEEVFKQAIGLTPENGDTYRAISILYTEIGKPELADEYAQKADQLRLGRYNPITANNYRKLKEILDNRGIRLVCVQYPMRNVDSLKKIFDKDEGIIFVDNESIFKEALKKANYKEYFIDMIGGDFGHCTKKGNQLLGQNIATVIIRELFRK